MSPEITGNIVGKGLAKIQIDEDRIGSVSVIGPADPGKPFVSPGFLDLQINGFAGVNFSDSALEPEQACSVLQSIWRTGTTTFCPTLITNSQRSLIRNFRILEAARRCNARFARAVPCYHMEGPYLSPGPAHGVHDPRWMRLPSWDEFTELQEAAGGRIGIITLAPELPGALDLIDRAGRAGVVVALGHTDANPEQIHLAVKAGARLSTHLGNGCPQMIHRHQNPLWAQLALDQLTATLICDTFHLPADFVKVVLRTKRIHRCILISDATHVATMPPGRYQLVGTEIELFPSGKVERADGLSLAGSALTMNQAVSMFMQLSGATLQDAVQAATQNPALLLQRPIICSELASGQPANIVQFEFEPDALQVTTVWSEGEQVHPPTC